MQKIIIAISEDSIPLAKKLAQSMANTEIHTLNYLYNNSNRGFSNLSEHLKEISNSQNTIIAICSIGIMIRALNGNIEPKHSGSPIIVISPDGKYVIPLLNAHSGANQVAKEIQEAIGSEPIITTLSDIRLNIALDDPPNGYAMSPDCDYKKFATKLIKYGTVNSMPNISWLKNSKIVKSEKSHLSIISSIYNIQKDENTLVYHPQKLVIGIGTIAGIKSNTLKKFILGILDKYNLSIHAVWGFATIDLKKEENAINDFAEEYKKQIIYYSNKELDTLKNKVPSPSKYVYDTIGTHSVSESAALLAAGIDSKLIVKKQKIGEATCSIALSKRIIKKHKKSQNNNGLLKIIGLGPGRKDWRTLEVDKALTEVDYIIGFEGYIKQLTKIQNKKYYPYKIGEEEIRARKGLNMATQGKKVAIVCSGDPGIYAMGSIIYELIDKGTYDLSKANVYLYPGISAFQAAASKVGAPFGHDFCIISLSNLLTPEEIIKKKLLGALDCDFVIGLYNPTSHSRERFFIEMLAEIKKRRPPETIVIIAREVGRQNEKIDCILLKDINPTRIDMLTLIIIGSSNTKLFKNYHGEFNVYTPRGYSIKSL